jgi:hypothetical protein
VQASSAQGRAQGAPALSSDITQAKRVSNTDAMALNTRVTTNQPRPRRSQYKASNIAKAGMAGIR